MATTLTTFTTNESRETIDLGEDGDLVVIVRRPTAREKLRDDSLITAGYAAGRLEEHGTGALGDAISEQQWFRLTSTVIGWEGVENANGHPVKFTEANLQAMMLSNENFMSQVLALANRAFAQANTKNFLGPSEISSTDGPVSPEPSKNTSEGETSPTSENASE